LIRTSLDNSLVTIDTSRARCKMCISRIETSPSDDFCSEECQSIWQAEGAAESCDEPDRAKLARLRAEADEMIARHMARMSVEPMPHCTGWVTTYSSPYGSTVEQTCNDCGVTRMISKYAL
jgi:adenosylmethionine-8-amino-7-oxononanoate aminotransferase